MLQTVVVMTVAGLSAAIGQILLKKGMTEVGSLDHYAPMELVRYFWRALCNPWVVGGTVFSAGFYFLFLSALSWSPVSVVVPVAALEFLFTAILAVLILGEKVPTIRWIGILLTVCGVVLISRSGAET